MRHELPNGATVKFWHGRRILNTGGTWYHHKEGWTPYSPDDVWPGERPTFSSDFLLPTGGHTSCEITLPDGTKVVGAAECSRKDNYNKKIGRDIALGRALKQLEAA